MRNVKKLQTVVDIRKQLVTEGFDVVLDRKATAAACSEKNLTDSRKQNSFQHVGSIDEVRKQVAAWSAG